MLLKWNVQRGVAVIPKASSEAHARDNIEGLFAWRLTWDQKVRGDGDWCDLLCSWGACSSHKGFVGLAA